jgi:hypothetical protein
VAVTNKAKIPLLPAGCHQKVQDPEYDSFNCCSFSLILISSALFLPNGATGLRGRSWKEDRAVPIPSRSRHVLPCIRACTLAGPCCHQGSVQVPFLAVGRAGRPPPAGNRPCVQPALAAAAYAGHRRVLAYDYRTNPFYIIAISESCSFSHICSLPWKKVHCSKIS